MQVVWCADRDKIGVFIFRQMSVEKFELCEKWAIRKKWVHYAHAVEYIVRGCKGVSGIFDGFEVFLTEDDRETWFNDFLDSVEGLGLSFTYAENLTRNDGIYEMYEKAKTLKITRGEVYIG